MQRTIVFSLIVILLCGCGSGRKLLFEKVRTDLREGETKKAYENYSKDVKKTSYQRVDELLNLGLLAFEAGDYSTALKYFNDADRLSEERLTKSFTREAASLTTSDLARAYQGTVADKAMIHYYGALSYLAQNQLESAVVEGRRLASYLEVNARESKHNYKDDAFLQWFSGSLYSGYRQHNDAWISFKKSREIYDDFYGIAEPSFLCPVTLEAVKKVGVAAEEDSLAAVCPDAANELKSGYGRVVVLCETGVAPPIQEDNIVLPILTSDPADFADEQDRQLYADELYNRRHNYQYEQTRLRYLLRVALPYYEDDYDGTNVAHIAIRDSSGTVADAELGTSISRILKQDLEDRAPAIAIRAIVRAMIKYAASEAAQEIGGGEKKTAGLLLGWTMNLIGAVTEAADIRSWETLPDRIYAADFQLPPGEHELRAVFEDEYGMILLRHDFPKFQLNAEEVVFLRARCMK